MAARAFDQQAKIFDLVYGADTIINYKRKRVREHVLGFLKPQSLILELNAGTGQDAVYFASRGHFIHATDISGEMLEVMGRKITEKGLQHHVSTELCSFSELESLANPGPYDHIFSNFAGLNCTSDLDKVMDAFNPLLKPGGMVTLVLLPKFCLWEFLLLFRGKFKTAFRRFSGSKGAAAKITIGGMTNHFRCWYYNPRYIQNYLKPAFDVMSLEGLCSLVPPSYLEHFAEKHPGLYRFLVKKELRFKSNWPWRSVGDYFIITLRKKQV